MRPLVATTGAHIYTSEGYMQNLLWQVYMDGVYDNGGLPFLVTDIDQPSAAQLARQANGLFISGGMDVSPCCYAQERSALCGQTDSKRDDLEITLIRAFVEQRKPILGICRGFQMLNVFFGGTLHQDIKDELGYDHPYDSVHTVTAEPGLLIDQLFGRSFTVNSLHHQAVKELGCGLIPLAYADNAPLVEAYCHETLPIVAVQWHPERMTGVQRMSPAGPDMRPFLEHFISMCKHQL